MYIEEKESNDKYIKCKFMGEEDIRCCPEYIDKYLENDTTCNKDSRTIKLRNFNDRYMFRLSLECKLKDKKDKKDKIMTVILMNPSYANNNGLDDTLLHVKEFMEKVNQAGNKDYQYSSFVVLNVFPIRTAKSECLLFLLNKYDTDKKYCKYNLEYIKDKISAGGDFLLAWGANYHNTEQTQTILKELKQHKKAQKFVYHLNKGKEKSPSHFTSQVYYKIRNEGLKLIKVDIIENNEIQPSKRKDDVLEI